MIRTNRFRLAILATMALGTSPDTSADVAAPKNLDDIFAAVVVGTPPVNAFNGLFRCPDGEIRHYGDDGFLFSRDNGLTWNHRRFGEVDDSGKAAGGGRPLGMNPKTGTCLWMASGKDGMLVYRSTAGPDGQYTANKVDDRRLIMVRPPYFLRSRPRVLFAAHGEYPYRIRIKLLPGGGGGRICLVDRWFNPTDPVVQDYAMYALTIPGDGRLGNDVVLPSGGWHELRFDWDDSQSSICRLIIDGGPTSLTLPLGRPSAGGISYVHFQALSDEEDLQGFLLESVEGGK